MDGDDPRPRRADEEIVVIRLEGLGSFAVPVDALEAHRLPIHDLDRDGAAAVEAVPTILCQDFLRGVGRRHELAVDRFGGVHTRGGEPVFDDGR